MLPCWRIWLVIVLGAPVSTALAALPGVVTVTDMTPAGRQWTPPSPDQPVYYQGVNAGYVDFGSAIAGDREPPPDEFLQIVLRTLWEQGYRPSDEQHPPTLVLGLAWGSLRRNFAGALHFLGGEKLDLMWEVRQVSSMLDPRVLTRNLRSPLQERVMELAGDDLYVVRIAAYGREAALRGELQLLWETRIAAPARHAWAKDALPHIVRAGGPLIGRETGTPHWVEPDEARRRSSVEIGELESLGTFDLETLPLLDLKKEEASERGR